MPNKLSLFWQELKRRHVHRSLAIYAGTAFIILEAADIIFPRWGLPDWSVDLVLYLLIVGAVVTVVVSWIYDLTPQGITKTESVDLTGSEEVQRVSKKLKANTIVIALLMVIIGFLIYPKIFKGDVSPLGGTNLSSIAVLPLKIIGEDADLGFFASGLVESLTHMLTKIGTSKQAFAVIPSSEIVEATTASEARKKFGVSLVISGSIQKDRTSSRVILNLIDAKKQNLIRSEQIDYPADKNLIIQDEIISVMVSMLGMDLESDTKKQITLGGSGLNEANEYYLTGRGIIREGIESEEDIDAALGLFQRAIEKDTLFAKAYAGIAQAYTLKYHFTLDPSWNAESLKYSLRAVELNDQDSYALMILAGSLVETGDYSEALNYYEQSRILDSSQASIYCEMAYLFELEGKYDSAELFHLKAIELDPDSHLTHYYLGAFYHAIGRYDEAIVEINRALECSPGHLTIMHALGAIYWAVENFDDAIPLFEEILEIDSAQGRVYWNLGVIYYYKGDFDRSVEYFMEAEQYMPHSFNLYGNLGKSLYWAGEESRAHEAFSKAILLVKEEPQDMTLNIAIYFGLMGRTDSAQHYLESIELPEKPGVLEATEAFSVGECFLLLGKKTQAFEYIESSLTRGYGWVEVRHAPLYKSLADDPEFQGLVVRAQEDQEMAGGSIPMY